MGAHCESFLATLKMSTDVVETKEEKNRGCDHGCAEQTLDVLACLGRGGVTAGDGALMLLKHSVYPIKEAFYEAVDNTNNFFHPYSTRKSLNIDHVPYFRYGGTDVNGDLTDVKK